MKIVESLKRGLGLSSMRVKGNMPPELVAAITNAMERQGEPRKFKDGMPQELRELYAIYAEEPNLQPGMIVKWKKGMRNRLVPGEDGFAIVVEILAEPRYAPNTDAGTTQFYEPLDLVLGVIDPDGDFALFHFDRRRFRPIQE